MPAPNLASAISLMVIPIAFYLFFLMAALIIPVLLYYFVSDNPNKFISELLKFFIKAIGLGMLLVSLVYFLYNIFSLLGLSESAFDIDLDILRFSLISVIIGVFIYFNPFKIKFKSIFQTKEAKEKNAISFMSHLASSILAIFLSVVSILLIFNTLNYLLEFVLKEEKPFENPYYHKDFFITFLTMLSLIVVLAPLQIPALFKKQHYIPQNKNAFIAALNLIFALDFILVTAISVASIFYTVLSELLKPDVSAIDLDFVNIAFSSIIVSVLGFLYLFKKSGGKKSLVTNE